jgi:hypothetical protein
MAEIMTPPVVTTDGDGDPRYTFGEEHSWGDVVRWIMTNPRDGEEVLHLLQEALANVPPGVRVLQ